MVSYKKLLKISDLMYWMLNVQNCESAFMPSQITPNSMVPIYYLSTMIFGNYNIKIILLEQFNEIPLFPLTLVIRPLIKNITGQVPGHDYQQSYKILYSKIGKTLNRYSRLKAIIRTGASTRYQISADALEPVASTLTGALIMILKEKFYLNTMSLQYMTKLSEEFITMRRWLICIKWLAHSGNCTLFPSRTSANS